MGLPDSPERQKQELELQTTLAWALTATKGYSAADVEATLDRARALAEQLDRPGYLMPLIMGQWAFHLVRAEHRLALGLGEQLEAIGEGRNDAAAQLTGRYMRGQTCFFRGELIAARAALERSEGLADPAYRQTSIQSVDSYVVLLVYLAATLACLGYIDQARSRIDEAFSQGRRHAHTLAEVLCFASWIDWLTGSPEVYAEETLALATEHRFPFYLGLALAFRGRSLIALGQAQEALTLLTQGLTELRAIGAVVSTPALFIWLAEAYALLGQPDEERNCLAEAARIVEITEERWAEAELLHRVPGDLLKAIGDHSGAERHYRQAIAVAERQSAKLIQLKASTSLARLWRDQGKRPEARDLLGPIYHWFNEGFDAPVLKDAKALLDELA